MTFTVDAVSDYISICYGLDMEGITLFIALQNNACLWLFVKESAGNLYNVVSVDIKPQMSKSVSTNYCISLYI